MSSQQHSWTCLQALTVCSAATSSLVLSLYLWPSPRRSLIMSVVDLDRAAMDPNFAFDRLEPFHFRRRVFSFVVTILGTAIVVSRLPRPLSHGTAAESFLVKYYVGDGFKFCARSIICTMCLFLGPICEKLLSISETENETLNESSNDQRLSAPPNIICRFVAIVASSVETEKQRLDLCRVLFVAPVGEELFFRAIMFDLLRRSEYFSSSTSRILIASSFFFALSHAHHVSMYAIDTYRRDIFSGVSDDCQSLSRRAWISGLKTGVLHCSVVFLFGILSGGYFMSPVCGGNVAATGAAHLICNLVGEPHFLFLRKSHREGASAARLILEGVAYVAGLAGFVGLTIRFARR